MPQSVVAIFVCVVVLCSVYFITSFLFKDKYDINSIKGISDSAEKAADIPLVLDKKLYNERMIALANNPAPKEATTTPSTSSTPLGTSSPGLAATSTPITPSYESTLATLVANASATTSISIPNKPWPVPAAYPKYGALLPFNRIIAYYGNFYSTKMGVLGEYPPEVMLPKLMAEVAKWKAADPETPVIPAIHYIVTTAQGSAGQDGMYRLRMPDSQIQKAIDLAKEVNGIVFLDVQVGLSTLQSELPILAEFLKLPNVHLGIDPEFSMKTGAKPGTVIGTFSSADINYATNFLAKIVNENNLPPKILIIHRFTRPMVTGSQNIKLLPEVQVVIDMDGWGPPAQKLRTYHDFIQSEPVQFTGFKLFYKNDLLPPSSGMLTPAQLLKLTPRPAYIQYQ